MTREEALHKAINIISYFEAHFAKTKEAREDAVNIIEVLEQEPKTVIYSGDGYADGYMVYDMAECPNCGYEYEDGDKDWGENFCPHCGQPLKWESEE